MARLLPYIKQQFFDDDGKPLAGGKVFSYAAGTSTPLATFVDADETAQNTNPTILDSNGEAYIWLASVYYKFVIKDSNDVVLRTLDNVTSSSDDSADAAASAAAAAASAIEALDAAALAVASASAASTSETNAAASALAASGSASAASTSAGNASTSAGAASSSASAAAGSASSASTSAGNASSSASAAATSASNAAASAASLVPVVFSASKTGGNNNGASGIRAFTTLNKDTHSAFSLTTGEFTVPTGLGGDYSFGINWDWGTAQNVGFALTKNGAVMTPYGSGASSVYGFQSAPLTNLVPGDKVAWRSSTGSTVSMTSATMWGFRI